MFRERFLEANIQQRLLVDLLWPPWMVFRLASPEYDRINAAAEFYHREIFDEATFSRLPSRPVLRVHATNMALGSRFTFTQEDFDLIESDLSEYPLGYACAASSAFPVLLSPMTLRNYGETKSLEELKQSDRQYRRLSRDAREEILKDLRRLAREHYNDKTNRYVHLIDGGIVDNQGLEAILEELEGGGVINRRLGDGRRPLRRLILINVNAGVNPEDPSARSPSSPGLDAVVEHTMVASMDILSAKRWTRIQDFCDTQYRDALQSQKAGGTVAGLSRLERPYTIEISFRNIKDPEKKKACNDLPTSFALEPLQLELIDQEVPKLIAEDPAMIRLKDSVTKDLKRRCTMPWPAAGRCGSSL